MPVNEKYLAPFVEGDFFHVYNRTNGSHKLFRENKNYEYFLRSAEEYLSDVLDFYSYCLLPSHFHFVVQVKSVQQIQEFLKINNGIVPDINKVVSKQFKNFFIKYTMAFNECYERQGSLFNHRFRRVALEDVQQVKDCIFYVHSNPVHHSLNKDYTDYPWSSYQDIISNQSSIVNRNSVLELFGGYEGFKEYHSSHKPTIAKEEFRSF